MPRLVLVVDDSMLIRHAVTRFLEEHGCSVETAANGVEALEAIARTRPELVITDLNMPKMSGTELIAALRADPETAAIPVVIVAGRNSQPENEMPPDDLSVIYKDIDLEVQLKRALDFLLNQSGA